MRLKDDVALLPGVGPARRRALAERGIDTVEDLLGVLPLRYDDGRRIDRTADLDGRVDEFVTVAGALSRVHRIFPRGRRRLQIVRAILTDDHGSITLVWFNQPWFARDLTEGARYAAQGKVRRGRGGGLELLNPRVTREEDFEPAIAPVYGRVAGLGPALVRRLLSTALDALAEGEAVDGREPAREPAAPEGLPTLEEALRALHRPPQDADPEALHGGRSAWHERLAFERFYRLQLELEKSRRARRAVDKGRRIPAGDAAREVVRSFLPFRLTPSQRRVTREIVEDLRAATPMMRLLQGDVGCGKTVVAATAAAVVLDAGYQVAFMAPTEILARQLHRQLDAWLGQRFGVRLITAGTRQSDAREAVATGRVGVAVGTHALVEEATDFDRLGLVVVDEQHRFGVHQRHRLIGKGARPDVLVMTATPIPRSLALALYGDLHVSTIDELPPGRRPVATRLVPTSERPRVLETIDQELADGGRAFVVLPVIEEGESAAASIETVGALYQQGLGHPTAAITGRDSADARTAALDALRRGEISCLVATTVIEVGIDVPEASLMVIEDAQRFGLAQLHQLRGRVGRGERPGRCIAVAEPGSELAAARLAAFVEENDGFVLAERDLELRGPGDLTGDRQAGFDELSPALFGRLLHLMEPARRAARRTLEEDP